MQELLREYLNELGSKQKKRRRNHRIAAIFAVVVVGSVIWALARSGVAMTGEPKCGLEEHTHSEECYEEILVCGQEESEGHHHTDACYTTESVLICELEEGEEHTHTDECYAEESVLSCGQEESEGHQHTDACYESFAACGKEEHTHTELCYIDKDAGVEDASKWDEQYKDVEWKDVWGQDLAEAARMQLGYTESENNYIIGADESHKGYTRYGQFAEDAYVDWDAAFVNFCMHYAGIEESQMFPKETDTVKWYEEFTKSEEQNGTAYLTAPEGYVPAEGDLIFFDKEEEETAFQMGIVSSYDEEKNEIKVIEGNCDNEVKENEYKLDDVDNHIFAYVKVTEMEAAYKGVGTETETPVEETEDTKDTEETEGEADAENTEAPMIEKTYEGENFTVTVAYGEDAEIPENAELVVKQITPDTDEEHFAERESQLQEKMQDETAVMRALLDIGFYVDGEEIEPKSAVKITVQFLDENGLTEGSPITVIHFANEGTEVLDGSDAADNSTTFQMESFSEVGITEGEAPDAEEPGETSDEEPNEAPNETVPVAEDFQYENEAFRIIFHIEGNAVLTANKADDVADADTAGGSDGEEDSADGESDAATGDEGFETEGETSGGSDETDEAVSDEDVSEETDSNVSGDAGDDITDENASSEGDASGTPDKTVIEQNGFRFVIEGLDEDTEEYQKFSEFAEQIDDGCEQFLFQVMRYALFYDGVRLDLTNCEVTADIIPTEKLKEYARKAAEESTKDESAEKAPIEGEGTAEEESGTEDDETLVGASDGADFNRLSVLPVTKSIVQNALGDATEETEILYDNILLKQESDGVEVILSAYVGDKEEISRQGSTVVGKNNETTVMTVDMPYDMVAFEAENNLANPRFTVQYYANLNVVDYDNSGLRRVVGNGKTNELNVINTEGKKLPTNGKGTDVSPNDNNVRTLYVSTSGDTKGQIITKSQLTEVYKSRPFEYHKAPTINYMNALVENTNYELKEVWVLKTGKDVASTDRNDWEIHTYNDKLHFTNRGESHTTTEGETYVYIEDGAVIRFVYDTTNKANDFEAAFYDYDLGDGLIYSSKSNAQNQTNGQSTSSQGTGTWYMHTAQSGINSPSNYTGSGVKLAFGNANTGSGLQHVIWSGNLLNKFNGTQNGHPTVTGSYKGCTFGLATALDGDGKIIYNTNVNVPKLFNEGDAKGKTSYDNKQYPLTFQRIGDTYTLTGVKNTNTQGLDKFNNPSYATTIHYRIWTNNFWPMDSAPSYGTDGHDMKFGNYANTQAKKYNFAGQAGGGGSYASADGQFPQSDDGLDHNSYFGLHYKVKFDLKADYVGPLEYYFFGDDDMWVFLDGKLVCDIGGVHSSVGEYVNLWDYLEKGSETSAGEHTLSFFYTERGESGSTCWMQFTLPSVSSMTPEDVNPNYGQLKVGKRVEVTEDGEQKTYSGKQDFEFKIKLTGPNGERLKDDYSYVKYSGNTQEESSIVLRDTLYDGASFLLKDNEYIVIKYLPEGTKYEITEITGSVTVGDVQYGTDVDVKVNGNPIDRDIANGDIHKGIIEDVQYVNKVTVYKLPATGGSGLKLYTIVGGLFVLSGAGLVYRKRRKEVLRGRR